MQIINTTSKIEIYRPFWVTILKIPIKFFQNRFLLFFFIILSLLMGMEFLHKQYRFCSFHIKLSRQLLTYEILYVLFSVAMAATTFKEIQKCDENIESRITYFLL